MSLILQILYHEYDKCLFNIKHFGIEIKQVTYVIVNSESYFFPLQKFWCVFPHNSSEQDYHYLFKIWVTAFTDRSRKIHMDDKSILQRFSWLHHHVWFDQQELFHQHTKMEKRCWLKMYSTRWPAHSLYTPGKQGRTCINKAPYLSYYKCL